MCVLIPRKVFCWLSANSVTAHIVGFAHEHQRGDARQYVRFHCDALDWYEEAKAHLDSIKNGEEAFTPGMSAEEKMAKV
jgi:hypothetical protein